MASQIQAAQQPRLERGKAVSERTSVPLASLYRMAREGRFPKPFKISERSSAWDSGAVDSWIAERIASSKKAA